MDTTTKIKLSPKDFFLYVGAMAALYTSAVSLISLWFEYINTAFPDELQYYVDPFLGAIRWSVAVLVVIFPLYVVLTRIINQDVRRNPEKSGLWLRKWLIYLTLFVAGITIAVDLIVLINTYLGGDITMRFVFKVATVLLVIGSIFAYYFYDLRGRWERNVSQSKLIGALAGVLVLSSLIAGFFIIGSPGNQRDLRFDQQRTSDLQTIQWQLVSFWQQKERLPQTLTELEDPITGFRIPVDPQTKEPYSYSITGYLAFELCATFNKESTSLNQGISKGTSFPRPISIDGSVYPLEGDSWQHGAGEICFARTIDPERYPPFQKQ